MVSSFFAQENAVFCCQLAACCNLLRVESALWHLNPFGKPVCLLFAQACGGLLPPVASASRPLVPFV
jgi:hypothetical protein